MDVNEVLVARADLGLGVFRLNVSCGSRRHTGRISLRIHQLKEYSLRGWAVQGGERGKKLYTLDFLGLALRDLGNQGGG